MFTLMDPDNLKVVINVLEKDVPRITIGAAAVITADALPEESLTGRVGRLSQAVDPATRTMPVEVFVSSRGPSAETRDVRYRLTGAGRASERNHHSVPGCAQGCRRGHSSTLS